MVDTRPRLMMPPTPGTGSRNTADSAKPRKREDKKPMHALVQLVEKRLRDADPSVREAVVEALPQLYAPNDQLMDVSFQLLEHEDWFARRAAAQALARLGDLGGAVAVAREAGPRLDHDDAETRRCAALALIGLADKAEDVKAVVAAMPKGPTKEEAAAIAENDAQIQALISGNASPEILAAAAQQTLQPLSSPTAAAGEPGEGEPDMTMVEGADLAATEVGTRLRHESAAVRLNAVRTMARMQSSSEPQAAKLGACVEDTDCLVRAETVKAFDELGNHVVEGAAEAAAGLASQEHIVRITAQRALLAIAKYDPEVAAAGAAAQLKCSLPLGRVAALDTMAKIGESSAAHAHELISTLQDESVLVRRAALRAIVKAGPGVATHVQQLVRLLSHHDPDIARVAVEAIRGLGAQEPDVVEAVAQPLHEELEGDEGENATMRKQAVEILGGAGENAIPYLGDIVKELEDSDWSVRRAAVEALDDLGAHAASAAAQVASRLVHSEAEVRRAAAEAIGRMGINAGRYRNRVEVLMDTEEDLDVRIACQKAVEAQREVSRALRRPSGSAPVPQALLPELVQQEKQQPRRIVRHRRR